MATNPFAGVVGAGSGSVTATPGSQAGQGSQPQPWTTWQNTPSPWNASNPVNYGAFTNYWWNTNDPGGGVAYWLQGQGQNQFSPYGQFMGGLTGSLFNGYQAALATQLGLNFTDFITQQQGNLQNAYGLNRFRYGGGLGGRRVL